MANKDALMVNKVALMVGQGFGHCHRITFAGHGQLRCHPAPFAEARQTCRVFHLPPLGWQAVSLQGLAALNLVNHSTIFFYF